MSNMNNMKKYGDKEIANLYKRLDRVRCLKENVFYKYKFEPIWDKIGFEINRRNRAKIFKVACQVLKNRNFSNQFAAAAHYADAIMNDCNYFTMNESHEINSYYTRSRNPVLVDLVMYWAD